MTSSVIMNVPVLYVEESIKTTRSEVQTKYDTDWRIYIILRYGKYLFLGTRQPVYSTETSSKKHKHELTWPVVSMSFNHMSDVYSYVVSLLGCSKMKVNTTLYISSKSITDMDNIFVTPSHENMQIMDSERSNRKMELVGYDRVTVPPMFFDTKKTNIFKRLLINIDIMSTGPSGVGISFTCGLPTTHTTTAASESSSSESRDLEEEAPTGKNDNDDYDYEYNMD